MTRAAHLSAIRRCTQEVYQTFQVVCDVTLAGMLTSVALVHAVLMFTTIIQHRNTNTPLTGLRENTSAFWSFSSDLNRDKRFANQSLSKSRDDFRRRTRSFLNIFQVSITIIIQCLIIMLVYNLSNMMKLYESFKAFLLTCGSK